MLLEEYVSAVAVRGEVDSAAASKQQEKEGQQRDRQEEVGADVGRARDHARLGARRRVVRVLLHGGQVWRVVRTRSNPGPPRRTRGAR